MVRHLKFWKKYVLDFLDGILLRATYPGFWKIPMGGQNFKLFGFYIWLQVWNLLKKMIIWKCLSFLIISMGTLSKLNFHFQKKGNSSFFYIKNYIKQLWWYFWRCSWLLSLLNFSFLLFFYHFSFFLFGIFMLFYLLFFFFSHVFFLYFFFNYKKRLG